MTNSKPHRTRLVAILAVAVAGLSMLSAAPAEARSRQAYTMQILVDGLPLDEYAARGTTYVEALEGREYAIRLTNHTGRRVAVALSVDGLNTIDAKTTPIRDASRWIIDPWQSVTIDGWQTGQDTARRFFFTSEDRSYGAWLGKTNNLGIVSAAFFPEQQRRRAKIEQRRERSGRALPGPSAAPSVPSKRHDAAGERDSAAESEAGALSDEMAATGIGRELDHRVRRVRFLAEHDPAALIDVRYEYRDELIRLGVLRGSDDRRLSRRERSRGFTDSSWAPDPFAAGGR